MIKYDAAIALQYSCAIDRLLKSGALLKTTRRMQLIHCLFDTPTDDSKYIPVTVEPIDIDNANTIIEYCKKYVMDILAGAKTDGARLYSVITTGEVKYSQLKLVADSPVFYDDQIRLDRVSKRIKECNNIDWIYGTDVGRTSKALLNVECEVIDCFRTSNYPGYNITGVIDNKLVSWYTEDDYTVGSIYNINAYIKGFGHSWIIPSIKETRLTRVKVL